MRIVFTGGGTLGSVTPLLALASQHMQESFIWIGTKHGPEKTFVEQYQIPFYGIPSYKLRRYFSIQTVSEIPNLLLGYRAALKILQSFHATVVVSAGGYVSVPVCHAAKSLGIPYIIVQLDSTIGLSNKILSKNAACVCTAFEKHKNQFTHLNVHWTGIPVANPKKESTFQSNKPLVVILGGGTGSLWLNTFVLRFKDQLSKRYTIFHLYGSSDRVVEGFKKSEDYQPHAKINHESLLSLIHQSTLVVARAGMGSLSEIAFFKKPSIIIPMPHSHQVENAKIFCEQHASICFSQTDGYSKLYQLINSIMNSRNKRDALSQNISKVLPTDAGEKIWNQIQQCTKK